MLAGAGARGRLLGVARGCGHWGHCLSWRCPGPGHRAGGLGAQGDLPVMESQPFPAFSDSSQWPGSLFPSQSHTSGPAVALPPSMPPSPRTAGTEQRWAWSHTLLHLTLSEGRLLGWAGLHPAPTPFLCCTLQPFPPCAPSSTIPGSLRNWLGSIWAMCNEQLELAAGPTAQGGTRSRGWSGSSGSGAGAALRPGSGFFQVDPRASPLLLCWLGMENQPPDKTGLGSAGWAWELPAAHRCRHTP